MCHEKMGDFEENLFWKEKEGKKPKRQAGRKGVAFPPAMLAAAYRKLAERARGQTAQAARPCGRGRRLAAVSREGQPRAIFGVADLCVLSFILVHSADATCQHLAPLKITPYKYPATIQ